jgi:hypothetical protein
MILNLLKFNSDSKKTVRMKCLYDQLVLVLFYVNRFLHAVDKEEVILICYCPHFMPLMII